MKTILEKIAENAVTYPDRKAYSVSDVCGENREAQGLSWQQLNTFSDKLATYIDRTCKTNTPIVVYGHKDPYMLVCFLACVKSGRAYCPIDISVPLNRVKTIVDEVCPELILTTESLDIVNYKIIARDEIITRIAEEQASIGKEKWVGPEDVFYIIFTSGSTGTPKGVQITRSCLDNFIQWAIGLGACLQEREHYTFINQAPFSFDLSVMDLYMSLYTGGTLWALTKKEQNDMRVLLQSLESSEADVWVSTPSFADVCLSDRKFSQEILPNMKLFLFCGETLTNRTVERLRKAFPNARIVNTYGPTESTVAVTDILVTSEVNEKYNPLPVGRPKNGTRIFIVDEKNRVLPDGEKGEIVIVGDSVSIGYWNKPELSNKVFGSCELEGRTNCYYRTGDKGYIKEDLVFAVELISKSNCMDIA